MQELHEACNWAGTTHGRVQKYEQLLLEFMNEGGRSQDHIFAHNEISGICEIYRFWKNQVQNFPGLLTKIGSAFNKGTILPEYEKPETSSNRPRNDAFVYLLGGKLLNSDAPVLGIDGVLRDKVKACVFADILLEWEKIQLNVECKRPQTKKALKRNVQEARKSLSAQNLNYSIGIIAIDCSAFKPPGMHLYIPSERRSDTFHKQASIGRHKNLQWNPT